MINTFIGKVNDWYSGLTEDSEKIIKNDTLKGLKNSVQEGIANLKQYIANEFFGGNEICRYTSGTFNDVETRYFTNEKELLAIVRGIRKFSAFLLPKQFVIRTDNTQVSGLIFNKLPSEPQYR